MGFGDLQQGSESYADERDDKNDTSRLRRVKRDETRDSGRREGEYDDERTRYDDERGRTKLRR